MTPLLLPAPDPARWVTVKKDGKEYHVREDGTPLSEERYEWVWDFSEDRAAVMKDVILTPS